MKSFLILGAGRQGVAIVDGLKRLDPEYYVALLDSNYSRIAESPAGLDVEYIHADEWVSAMSRDWSVVISALPYSLNLTAAKLAVDLGLRYMDLGGHEQTTEAIQQYAHEKDGTVAPDQGLAPGLVNLLAWDRVLRSGRVVEAMELYCGGLPTPRPDNYFEYYITFSPEGLVNEYMNEINVLVDREVIIADGNLAVDREIYVPWGESLEAFRTSGATPQGFLRNLASAGVQSVNYRTLRYPGHAEKVERVYNTYLLTHRGANRARDQLATFLARECRPPEDFEDVVFLRVKTMNSVSPDGVVYDERIDPQNGWTAMQAGTGYSAACVAAVMATGKVEGVVSYCDLVQAGFFAEVEKLRFLSERKEFP